MSGNRRILSVVVFMLGLALIVSAGAGADSITPPRNSSLGTTPTRGEYAIVRAMNAIRARHGVPPLRVGRALTRAARSHSADMARRGYFDHGPFVQRLRSFGVRAPYIGENLAYGGPALPARIVMQMWMESPSHRATLLHRRFQRVGVGVAGGSIKLVTADFAGR